MNRPLTSSPSRSFSFSPSDPRCPSASVRVRPSVPAPSWSTHPRLPVCPCSACRVTRLLFIRPQVRFECKMRKKVRRSLARSSPLSTLHSPPLSLSLSLSVTHYKIILRRVAACSSQCTPHLLSARERRSRSGQRHPLSPSSSSANSLSLSLPLSLSPSSFPLRVSLRVHHR